MIEEKNPMRLDLLRDSPRCSGFDTLSIAMKEKLARIIQAINYIKASAIKTKLFAKLCKDIKSNYGTPLFHKFV